MRIPLIEDSLSSWHQMKVIWTDLLEKTPVHDGAARKRMSVAIAECDEKIAELQHHLNVVLGLVAAVPAASRPR